MSKWIFIVEPLGAVTDIIGRRIRKPTAGLEGKGSRPGRLPLALLMDSGLRTAATPASLVRGSAASPRSHVCMTFFGAEQEPFVQASEAVDAANKFLSKPTY